MQLNKLGILTGLLLTALISACGGGGDEEAPVAAAPAPAITVSALSLKSAKAIAESPLEFDGGECKGGTGTLTAAWDFGDSTPVGSYAPHNYADSASGPLTVKVTCSDTAGTKPVVASLPLTVLSAAMNGFLGKNWTTYAELDPLNQTPYPVAGITSTGDVLGVWIRRFDSVNNEVVAGQTAFTQSNWTVASTPFATGSDQSPYHDSNNHSGYTAPIDMAVSPDGHALAAWTVKSQSAVLSINYATKNPSNSLWSVATPIPNTVGTVINSSIKVVINDAGNGAIAYCTSGGAYVIPYVGNAATGTPQKISHQCDVLDNGIQTYQRHRAFDIAIDDASKLVAVGVLDATLLDGTPDSTKRAVAVQTYSGTWSTTVSRIANGITTPPESLSLSLSGSHGAIAWSQIESTIANVYTSMWNGTTWLPAVAFTHTITPTTTYDRPLIAVNKYGDAFMTMRLVNSYGKVIAAANYNGTATPNQWNAEVTIDSASGSEYRATDIAIDNWGTGLVTNVDSNFRYTQAGTFAKQPGPKPWSGFKNISSARPDTVSYNSLGFNYQTMRALPDGRAILVTSIYDDRLNVPTTPSGYILLK